MIRKMHGLQMCREQNCHYVWRLVVLAEELDEGAYEEICHP
jgi:hypothetical protein